MSFIDRIPPIVLVALGGALGASTRYLITLLFKELKPIPWGTLIVNVIGSFALGVVFTMYQIGALQSAWMPLLGAGFMGSFTTMSSFAVETITLSDSAWKWVFLNFFLMLILVFLFAALGRLLILTIYKNVSPVVPT